MRSKPIFKQTCLGAETWIRLPPGRREPGWKGRDMVVPLHTALYGHPCAGKYWEDHCEKKVFECGFKKIGDSFVWRSCYYHPRSKVFLII
jgi:hypothetical protein